MVYDNISLLKSVDFFDVLNEEQLKLLAFTSEIHQFNSGEILLEKGEASEGAFIIGQGIVNIGNKQSNIYQVSGPSVMIGEISLLVKKTNHDVVRAQGNVLSLFVPRNAFQKLLQQYSDLAEGFAKKIENNLDEYLSSINEFVR